jgi:hypothetical protein
MGKSVDGFVEHSEVAQGLARPYLDGTSSFTDDLSRVLGSVNAAGIRDLTISALLLKLIRDGGPESEKLGELLSTAQRLGIADQPVATLNGAKQ